MATAQHHNRRARVLTFSYDHGGESRTACLEVTSDGGLRVVKCGSKKKFRGLGDAVAAVTNAVGIKPCGGCQRRREALNRATPNWLRRFLQRFKKSAERTDRNHQ